METSVAELVEDFNLYPRVAVSDMYVNELAEVLRSGAVLPPIVVDKTSKRIVDGLHRARAYAKVFGLDAMIPVQWEKYASEADMFADAIRRNADHGRRMCKKDLVRCVHIGGKHGLEVEDIASMAGLTAEKLGKLVADRTAYDENGDPVPLAAGLRHLAGQVLTRAQKRASSRGSGNVLFYARKLADLLAAGALDLTNEGLTAELVRLKDLLNRMVTA